MDDRAPDPYSALAADLTARLPDVLAAWRTEVRDDPLLSTAATLARPQLDDHIPDVLASFVRIVRAGPRRIDVAAHVEQQAGQAEHGLHRWRQGYHLREVVREWGHLQLCVLDAIERFPAADPAVPSFARRELAVLVRDGVSRSAAGYFELHRAEAVGQADEIGAALEQLRSLQGERSELLREAAHDLRGQLGVASMAAAGLAVESLPDATRVRFARLLQKGLGSLHGMLNDLMSLARLEAGREKRALRPFDAAAVLAGLCETTRPLADDAGLDLLGVGPASLPAEGDPVHVQRVAQNLILNAIKYTPKGGVTVRWAAGGSAHPGRWVLTVSDTGPGISPRGSVAAALEGEPPGGSPQVAGRGEGVGLSIVKRLCELLDATLDLDSVAGQGSTFTVTFPVRYPEPGGRG